MGDIELYSKRFLAISLVGVGDVESLRRGLSLLMELRGILSWDWEMFFYAGYAEMQVVGVATAEDTLKRGYAALVTDRDATVTLGALEAFLALEKKDYDRGELL